MMRSVNILASRRLFSLSFENLDGHGFQSESDSCNYRKESKKAEEQWTDQHVKENLASLKKYHVFAKKKMIQLIVIGYSL